MLISETDIWETTPIVYCSSTASLPLRPHCANARRIRCQADLISSPQRTGGDHHDVPVVRGWRLFSRSWNQWTCPWTKQSTWLRIVHSGDWCLRLALRTHSGAGKKRTNERTNQMPLPGCEALLWWVWLTEATSNHFLPLQASLLSDAIVSLLSPRSRAHCSFFLSAGVIVTGAGLDKLPEFPNDWPPPLQRHNQSVFATDF